MKNITGLLAKVWKNEKLGLKPGSHDIDEVMIVRVRGTVEKCDDQLVAPTVSIPLVTTLALLWEKVGVGRDDAMNLLREALTEAMADGVDENSHIKHRIDEVDEAIQAVKDELIARLPKMRRSGRLITKNLDVTVMPMTSAEQLAVA